jgi:hypothetical protein
MTETKKTIQINPNFFKVGSSTNNKKEKISKKKKNNLSNLNDLVKPNNVKKELLKRIKEKYKNNFDSSNNNLNDDTQFDNEFKKSLSYLENIIKEKERKKKSSKKKTSKKKLSNTIDQHTNTIIIDPPIYDNSNNNPISSFYSNFNPIKKNIQQTDQPMLSINNKEPSFGCLKGGNMPTFSQYKKTLKKNTSYNSHINQNNQYNKIKILDNEVPNKNILENKSNISIRKSKLKNAKLNSTFMKKKPEKIIKRKQLMKKLRKYRLKTIKKTYKLGKQNNKISVLIKNNITRKKIQNEIDGLDKVPLIEIRNYLKKKNLLKNGSSAPEHILRQLYKNTIISGDIYNKNKDTLIHNFFTSLEN